MLSSPVGGAGTAQAVTERVLSVRGRKLDRAFPVQMQFELTIYPREGTETQVASHNICCLYLAIYPCEGTETTVHTL